MSLSIILGGEYRYPFYLHFSLLGCNDTLKVTVPFVKSICTKPCIPRIQNCSLGQQHMDIEQILLNISVFSTKRGQLCYTLKTHASMLAGEMPVG